MRRRRVFTDTIIVLLFFLGTVYCAAILFLSEWVLGRLHDVGGGALEFRRFAFRPPFQIALFDVRVNPHQLEPDVFFGCRQVIVEPAGLDWRTRTIRLQQLRLESPQLQLVRTSHGALLVPGMAPPLAATAPLPASGSGPPEPASSVMRWQAILQTIQARDGRITVIDQRLEPPFHLTLTDLTAVTGPIRVPLYVDKISLAAQGRVVGSAQHSAPIYCSGWADISAGNLDVACKLEALRLAAFEPYYQGTLRSGLYNATLKATLRFTASANELDGRIQFSMENLSEADLAMLRTTLMTVKRLTGGSERVLTGEIQVSGPMNHPDQWRIQMIPGNDIMQRLVTPLLNRGMEFVQVRIGQDQPISIGLQPATEALMVNIRSASKSVEEDLRIVAPSPLPAVTSGPEEPPPAAVPAAVMPIEGPTVPTPEQPEATPSPAPSPHEQPPAS